MTINPKRLALEFVKGVVRHFPPVDRALRTFRRDVLSVKEREADLLPFLIDPKRPAIDIGANAGSYVQLLLNRCSRLIVVEPNPDCCAQLRQRYGARIELIEAAASNVEGVAMLRLPQESWRSGLATLAATNDLAGTEVHEIDVKMITIDSLDLFDVGFIKIDVEGFEEEVLLGAERTIKKCRPTLLIESEDRHKPQAVSALKKVMEAWGYEGFMLVDGRLVTVNEFSVRKHQVVSDGFKAELNEGRIGAHLYVNNFVFIPIR